MKQSLPASWMNSVPTGVSVEESTASVILAHFLPLSLSTSHVAFLLETLSEAFEAAMKCMDKKGSVHTSTCLSY